MDNIKSKDEQFEEPTLKTLGSLIVYDNVEKVIMTSHINEKKLPSISDTVEVVRLAPYKSKTKKANLCKQLTLLYKEFFSGPYPPRFH